MATAQPSTPLKFINTFEDRISAVVQRGVRVENPAVFMPGSPKGAVLWTPTALKAEGAKEAKKAISAENALARHPEISKQMAKTLTRLHGDLMGNKAKAESLKLAKGAIVNVQIDSAQAAERVTPEVHAQFLAKLELYEAGLSGSDGRGDQAGASEVFDFKVKLQARYNDAIETGNTVSYARLVHNVAEEALAVIAPQTDRLKGLIVGGEAMIDQAGKPGRQFLDDIQGGRENARAYDATAMAVGEIWRSNLIENGASIGIDGDEVAKMDFEELHSVIDSIADDAALEMDTRAATVSKTRSSQQLVGNGLGGL